MAESPVTMFGIYVSSLSVNLSWGGQGGSLQMTLVEDPDNDVTLANNEFGGLPPTGTAVYFKYGSFFMGGIFQRWTYNESVSGRTYDIVIESPTKLMDGVQIILEEFNAATDSWGVLQNYVGFNNSTYEYSNNVGQNPLNENTLFYGLAYITNCYNVFGYYENPLYGINGQFQNFGASGFTNAGIQVDKILEGITALSKPEEDGIFAGPLYLGIGPAEDDHTKYTINLDDVYLSEFSSKFADYRLKGPVKSLNTIMSEMADLFQFDYYYNIQPRNGIGSLADGGGKIDDAEISVKILNRTTPPDPGKIQAIIDEDLGLPDDQKKIMSYSLGKEFGESATQKIIWGGNRTRYIKVNKPSGFGQRQNVGGVNIGIPGKAYAVFGNTAGGALNLVGTTDQYYDYGSEDYTGPLGVENMFREFSIYIPELNEAGLTGNYNTNMLELRMALGGKEVWEIFKTFQTLAAEENIVIDGIYRGELNGFNNSLDCPWTGAFDFTKELLELLNAGNANAFDLTQTNLEKANKQWLEDKQKATDRIFNGVKGIAERSFGQEFVLLLPNEIATPTYNYYLPGSGLDQEYVFIKSWDVAGSAFDSSPVTADIADWDALGKIVPLVGYDAFAPGADFSVFGSDYSLSVAPYRTNTILSRKGKPEDEMLWNDALGVWVLPFNTGAQVRYFDAITTPDFGLTVLADLMFGVTLPPETYIFGKNSMQFSIPPNILAPNFFGVPQESQRFKWGPWLTLNSEIGFSSYGKTQVESKESLRPETFGSLEELNRIGGIEASVGQSDMQEVESGYVEMVGAPQNNLGERFAGTGPYVSNMSINVDATGGVKTSYQFNTWTPQFGTMNKYNIQRIADFKRRAFEFSKKNRDQIEKRPLPTQKFEKTDFAQAIQGSKRQSSFWNPFVWEMIGAPGESNGANCTPELCDQPGGGFP